MNVDEVVSHVLQYISGKDYGAAAKVSKFWHQCSCSPQSMNRQVFLLNQVCCGFPGSYPPPYLYPSFSSPRLGFAVPVFQVGTPPSPPALPCCLDPSDPCSPAQSDSRPLFRVPRSVVDVNLPIRRSVDRATSR